MFLLVFVRHVGAHLDGHLHGVSWRGRCIFTSFNLPDSGLYLLNSFDLYLSILNDVTLKTSDCLLCNNRFCIYHATRLPTALHDHPSYGTSVLFSLGQTAHNAQLLTADVNINRGQEHGLLQRAVVLE